MKNAFTIAGLTAMPGEKKQGYLAVADTEESIPVTVINGVGEGKTVLITSGVHGGEYEGIHACMELARDFTPTELHGQLVMVHPCSMQTFFAKQENITPADGKNLNRVYPPNPNGTLTDKIAHTLWEELQSKCEFHLDLHGCYSDWITPHLYYPGVADPEIVAISRQAAEVVSVPYMVKSTSTDNAYNYGGTQGIPGILLERGESNLLSGNTVTLYKKDVRNVLRHLGLLHSDMEPQEIQPQDTGKLHYVCYEGDQSGCWHCHVPCGEPFKKGDKLGEVRDFFCNILSTTYAECDGVSLYQYGMMPIHKGDMQICYAELPKTIN